MACASWLMNLGFAGGRAIAYPYPDYPRFEQVTDGFVRPDTGTGETYTRPEPAPTGGYDRP